MRGVCVRYTDPSVGAAHGEAFTTGNPFLGTKLLGFSIGRGSGALNGLKTAYCVERSIAKQGEGDRVCLFFAVNCYFHLSISNTTSVRADASKSPRDTW